MTHSDTTARIIGAVLIALSITVLLVDVAAFVGGVGATVARVVGGLVFGVGGLMVIDGWGKVSHIGAQLRYALTSGTGR